MVQVDSTHDALKDEMPAYHPLNATISIGQRHDLVNHVPSELDHSICSNSRLYVAKAALSPSIGLGPLDTVADRAKVIE